MRRFALPRIAMGVAFYPIFHDRPADWPDDMNGKCLARAADRLDKAAKKAKAGSIYSFYSMTREQYIGEALGGDPDDPTSFSESDVAAITWHEPEEGLRVIRAMLTYVRHDGREIDDLDCVREDLEAFERHLEAAACRGAKWFLCIDA
ncbi:MAG: hypothetical protein WD042_10350 [Phycisphaeraceae bacterium]